MGRDLFAAYPDKVRAADQVLGYSIQALCLEDANRQLSNTRYTQPALYVVGALAWRRHLETNPPPAYLLGHSLGEYNALMAAGAFGFEDGLRLVMHRGAVMAEAPEGAMAAVLGLAPDAVARQLEALGGRLDIANLNGPTQVIVSGPRDEIARAEPAFAAAGGRWIPLNTGGAFHSRQMAPARAAFARFAEGVTFAPPATPVISNVRAEPYGEDVARLLAEQITSPVQWMRSVQYLLDRGETQFVELGSGSVLTKLVNDISAQQPARAAPVPASAPAPSRIDAWNSAHPIGTRVRLRNQSGNFVTRTRAMLLFGHREAIYLESFNGYFALAEVEAVA